MKIRNGFVSNSSSSSFIVAFPKDLEMTEKVIQKYLFGDDTYLDYYDDRISTDDAVNHIFKEMLSQTPNDIENLRKYCNGWLDGAPEIKDFKNKKGEYNWKAFEKACDAFAENFLQKFLNKAKDMNVYAFEFADDTTFGAVLEHGDTFINTLHERISNH